MFLNFMLKKWSVGEVTAGEMRDGEWYAKEIDTLLFIIIKVEQGLLYIMATETKLVFFGVFLFFFKFCK